MRVKFTHQPSGKIVVFNTLNSETQNIVKAKREFVKAGVISDTENFQKFLNDITYNVGYH